jgi:methionyl-tRNA formyltransferase
MLIVNEADHVRALPGPGGSALRVAILRSDDPHHLYLQAVLCRHLQVVGVVVEPSHAQQRRLWRRGHRRAWMWRLYQGWRQRLTGRAAYRRRHFAVDGPAPPVVVTTDWINSPVVAATLRTLAPDMVVVCGTGYIQEATLAPVPLAINVHGGYLPRYRGNHGVYFAYEAGDFHRIGASLHLVTPALDGGPVIGVVCPEIRPGDQDEHLYCRSVKSAIDALPGMLLDLQAGRPLRFLPQPAPGRPYRHRDRTPGRELRLWWRRRLGRHPVPHLPARTVSPDA